MSPETEILCDQMTNFLQTESTLTFTGIVELISAIKEGVVAALFWNKHFHVVTKRNDVRECGHYFLSFYQVQLILSETVCPLE